MTNQLRAWPITTSQFTVAERERQERAAAPTLRDLQALWSPIAPTDENAPQNAAQTAESEAAALCRDATTRRLV
ncbi:MAG TPA: hypothetical protein PLD20_22300 [Blastocatellia bacterium]|nr:hypothetical protein [Blastocatellia bacterium]HMY73936.1 hypothetical protein [Blastocatellia bacterium]HMZ20684.1 hypothetical protein [Blastocatellia bacterium]HNG34499.1 hypothetical protein [Blastocatellia bacterium]